MHQPWIQKGLAGPAGFPTNSAAHPSQDGGLMPLIKEGEHLDVIKVDHLNLNQYRFNYPHPLCLAPETGAPPGVTDAWCMSKMQGLQHVDVQVAQHYCTAPCVFTKPAQSGMAGIEG